MLEISWSDLVLHPVAQPGGTEGQLTPPPKFLSRAPLVSDTFREKAGKGGPLSRMRMKYGEILKNGWGPHTRGPALEAMTPLK